MALYIAVSGILLFSACGVTMGFSAGYLSIGDKAASEQGILDSQKWDTVK